MEGILKTPYIFTPLSPQELVETSAIGSSHSLALTVLIERHYPVTF